MEIGAEEGLRLRNASIAIDRRQISMAANKLILLTGATGYIGGRLLKELEARGGCVRCLARQPEFLRARRGRH